MTGKYRRKARLTVTTEHGVFSIVRTWYSDYECGTHFGLPSIDRTWYSAEGDDGTILNVRVSEIIAVMDETLESGTTAAE